MAKTHQTRRKPPRVLRTQSFVDNAGAEAKRAFWTREDANEFEKFSQQDIFALQIYSTIELDADLTPLISHIDEELLAQDEVKAVFEIYAPQPDV